MTAEFFKSFDQNTVQGNFSDKYIRWMRNSLWISIRILVEKAAVANPSDYSGIPMEFWLLVMYLGNWIEVWGQKNEWTNERTDADIEARAGNLKLKIVSFSYR